MKLIVKSFLEELTILMLNCFQFYNCKVHLFEMYNQSVERMKKGLDLENELYEGNYSSINEVVSVAELYESAICA
jgi:hypothetical protein